MSLILAIASLVFIVTVVATALILLYVRRRLQRHITTQFSVRDDRGIESLEPVLINGVEQWLHIRGRDKNNPVLLFIHGGPAWPHIGWYDEIQRPWEDYFTVVQWDQRQAGKSYHKGISHTISHETYIKDAEAVIAYLRDQLGVDKVFVMGTSYGTYLGMQIVKRRPEWLHAYIGMGQVVAMAEHAKAEYQLLLEYARKHQHRELIAKLEAIAPYPDPNNPAESFYKQVGFLMEEESRLGKAYPTGIQGLVDEATVKKWCSPHYSLKDIYNQKFGDPPACADPKSDFYQDFYRYDLPQEIGSSFDVPIFFFTGAHDFHVAYTVTDSWFQTIKAPYKEQVWFEQSAHVPHQEEPHKFLDALVNKVRPFASSSDSQKRISNE